MNCEQTNELVRATSLQEWMLSMSSDFWAAIVGAVVGSVVAGLIAYLIQQQVLKASAKQHEEEAKERRQALGHALLFKMIRIHTDLGLMRMHLDECLGKLETKEHAGMEPWQVVLPIVNPAETVHFSTDEMALLLSLKDNDLFNDLSSFDVIHNSTIELFRAHASQRAALFEMLHPSSMDGMIGETTLTKEQFMRVRPSMLQINALLNDMHKRCTGDAEQAWDVLQRLVTILNEKLELGVSVLPKKSAG